MTDPAPASVPQAAPQAPSGASEPPTPQVTPQVAQEAQKGPPAAPKKLITIVVSPVELTVVTCEEQELRKQLESMGKSFSIHPVALVASGLVRVFQGEPMDIRVRDAEVLDG